MRIQSMFKEDINRKINGVVQVGQSESDVLVQELKEYVITKELKKHFIAFFNNYTDSFSEPTNDIGVWISGFFGSGKSHFLKMLSYLLENKEVQNKRPVEYFRQKFEGDAATFMLIDKATQGKTDTILFNIDVVGSSLKDKTAVLRVFAKMFYNHLGFYGEDLKVAKLEQYLSRQGKLEEFHQVFEELHGEPWLECRDSYAFFEDDVVPTLQKVLGMTEQSASNWFNGIETVETSISQIVSEIKEYVDAQPDDYRLLFMIDEVGQYIGENTGYLLNLQTIVEELGSKCHGKVWVICTGQEAIDEIIRARENEFSRIQARFKTRLSLSSSSADEVIQKRLLSKTEEAEQVLKSVYATNDSVLRNLLSFTDAVKDIKGFSGESDFTRNFPFVPYQFILMQKVFTEIRKHGNSGKHLSSGERSMLSGFQEAAKKISARDEFALVPFHYFYDTVHEFLEGSIRRVIERCDRAAQAGAGLEPRDVSVLELLYLIRYVDDVKANLDNIVILMADDIRMDKITMREQVRESLNRLLSQNYIGRTGETYNFLTDEEQDIQRQIKNTPVSSVDIVGQLGSIIFDDIYTTRKFRYGKMDFPFDKMVDTQVYGTLGGNMLLQILTAATDDAEKEKARLMTNSLERAIVLLAGDEYYESLENAMKIRKFVKQRSVNDMSTAVQDIIRKKQDEATRYENNAKEYLRKAIQEASFYINGQILDIKTGEAKSRLDQALEYLASMVYSKLELITRFAQTDEDILSTLQGGNQHVDGWAHNQEAAAEVEQYLEMQYQQKRPTTMLDVQSRFQRQPYGWREIDVANVVAMLIYAQKVTIKYGGVTIQPGDSKLPAMLRKKTEYGKTTISLRQAVSAQKMRAAQNLLREFFDEMDIPEDEDGLVACIARKFEDRLNHYKALNERYTTCRYPDQAKVSKGIALCNEILSQRTDNIALIQRLLDREDDLFDMQEALQKTEDFFRTQVKLFDTAVQTLETLRLDREEMEKNAEAHEALNQIRLITSIPTSGSFRYDRIPELNGLLSTVRDVHRELKDARRAELLETVRQCMEEIHTMAEENTELKRLSNEADSFYDNKKKDIAARETLNDLNALEPPMLRMKADVLRRMEQLLQPAVATAAPAQQTHIKQVRRMTLFPAKVLKNEADIDAYVEQIRTAMKQQLTDCDGIQLN